MTPTTQKVTQLSSVAKRGRRPRSQYMEGFSIYADNQEKKFKANEPIDKDKIQEIISDIEIVVKRLRGVQSGKLYTPPKPQPVANKPKATGGFTEAQMRQLTSAISTIVEQKVDQLLK